MNSNPQHENSWQTQEAKAHLSEVIKKAIDEGDQFISSRGKEVVVMMSKERYEALLTPKDSLLEFFYAAPYAAVDIDMERNLDFPREVDL